MSKDQGKFPSFMSEEEMAALRAEEAPPIIDPTPTAPPALPSEPADEGDDWGWTEDEAQPAAETTVAAEPQPEAAQAIAEAEDWGWTEEETQPETAKIPEPETEAPPEPQPEAAQVDESPILGQPDEPQPAPEFTEPPKPVSTVTEAQVSNVLARSTCVSLTLRRPGNTARLSPDAVRVDADPTMTKSVKQLLDSPELDAIVKFDGEIRSTLRAYCVPVSWLSGKAYLIPIGNIETCEKQLRDFAIRRRELIEDFCRAYPIRIQDARDKLRSNFDENDYPPVSSVRKSFDMQWNYLQIGTPDQGTIGKELYEAEKRKLSNQWKDAAQEMRDAMRFLIAKYIEAFTSALTPGEDGKKKAFKDASIDNLKEALEGFTVKNLTDDAEMAKLVADARKVLEGVDAKTLRKDGTLRDKILKDMEPVQTALKGMVEEAPIRRFDLD